MKNNRILPIGLKGNQINERMMELMGINQINENKSNIAVELTKMGPDGRAYAIIRENHEYYIKLANKTSGLIAEDFKYIGGLQNKKQEAYPSYAKAIKHLNIKFNSIQEALDTRIDINVFEDDNLLNEDIAGFSNAYGGGFSGEGNLEGNTPLYEEEDLHEEDNDDDPCWDSHEQIGTKEKNGKQVPNCVPKKKNENNEEDKELMAEVDMEMSDEEKAIDEMLEKSYMQEKLYGNQDEIDMDGDKEITPKDFAILRGDETEEETNESWMNEKLYGNQDEIDMDGDKEITPKDFAILRNKKNMEEGTYEEGMYREGTYEENYIGEEEMGMEPQKPTLSTAKTNAQWIEALNDADAKDIIASLYNELGAPVLKAAKKVVGFIGGPDVKDAINKRFPENESLYEGKLSINRAIDKMDSIIDSLIETDVKKKD